MKGSKPVVCECGLKPADVCCRAIHSGVRQALTAEELMRSRYTAFCIEDEAYLLATWHPSKRPDGLNLAADKPTKWLGLDVRKHLVNGDRATVEFVARFKEGGGPAYRLHEVSRFVKEEGRWYYLDGDIQG